MPGLEGAEGIAYWVGHHQKEEADGKVPARLVDMAQHPITGTDFPNEPELHTQGSALFGFSTCAREALAKSWR